MKADKILGIIAVILVLVAAFVPGIPYIVLALALLGFIHGLIGVPVERRVTYMVTALALAMSVGALGMVPVAGDYITAIFRNLSVVLNAGVLAVVVMIVKDRLTE